MYTTHIKICPACKRENPESASICAYCGTALVGVMSVHTTGHVPEQPIKIQPPDHILQLTSLYADILALVVLGQDQPILVRGGNKVILGRYSAGETTPSVDLSAYNAALLGVSRQHASISRPEHTYLLQDLGSTNGTWVNESKLTPNTNHELKNGDLVRLGQLAMYVYFNTESVERPIYATLKIRQRNPQPTETKVTLNTLAETVVPFLQAVASIQKICDEVLERTPETVSLHALNADNVDGIIQIQLSGANEAINLLKTKYVRWQKQQEPPKVLTSSDSVPTLKPDEPVKTETNGTEPPSPAAKLADVLVEELAPFRAETFQKTYSERLIEPLKKLLESPFTPVVDE